jgi:hypothetical protein
MSLSTDYWNGAGRVIHQVRSKSVMDKDNSNLRQVAKGWVHKNVVLAEHTDIEYADLERSLTALLSSSQTKRVGEGWQPRHNIQSLKDGDVCWVDSTVGVVPATVHSYPGKTVFHYAGADEGKQLLDGGLFKVYHFMPLTKPEPPR